MDAPVKYQVLASGRVLEGYNLEDVQSSFSKKFKLKPERAQAFFDQKPKVIKKNLDETTAQKYKVALDQLGVDASIEEIKSEDSDLSLIPISGETQDESNEQIMVCPKCGVEQDKAMGCNSCGIIIEKYESAQEALQQTVDDQPSQVVVESSKNDTVVDDDSPEVTAGILSMVKNKLNNLFSRH